MHNLNLSLLTKLFWVTFSRFCNNIMFSFLCLWLWGFAFLLLGIFFFFFYYWFSSLLFLDFYIPWLRRLIILNFTTICCITTFALPLPMVSPQVSVHSGPWATWHLDLWKGIACFQTWATAKCKLSSEMNILKFSVEQSCFQVCIQPLHSFCFSFTTVMSLCFPEWTYC